MKQMLSTREAYAMVGVLAVVGTVGAASMVLGPSPTVHASGGTATSTPSASAPAGVKDGENTEQSQESYTPETSAETLSSSPSPSDGAVAPADQADTPLTTPTDDDSALAESSSHPTSEASDTTSSEPPAVVTQTVSQQLGIHPLREGEVEHYIQPGQTLASISADYGISVDALALRNNLQDIHMIYEGSALIVPVAVD